MIKILLCCGGGFSSSAIAQRMQNDIERLGKQNEYSMEFYPLTLADHENKINDYDVVICCPHLKMEVAKLMQSQKDYHVPIYLLPPRIYGNMKLEEILMDVEDIIHIYQIKKQNPVIFPNEENLLKITRNVAYRHAYPNKEII